MSAMTSNKRSRNAKDCTKSIQQSLEVETNLPIQSNKSDKSAINNLNALKNMHIDLMLPRDGDTVLLPQRIRLHLRHHDGNQAATCSQRETGIRGNPHLGVNSDLLTFQMSDFFACHKFNLLESTGGVNSTRAHLFLMHSCCTIILSLISRTD